MAFAFTPEMKQGVEDALNVARDLREDVVRAKAAGLDVKLKEEELNKRESQLLSIKQSYFPNG